MPEITVPFFTAVPAIPPPWPGIVVVMEGNGISPQLLRVCQRLAHEGYATVAPDLYWRSGGSDPDKTPDQMVALTQPDGLADLNQSAEWLRTIGATKVGVTGFCMGGGYAYLAAVSGGFDAAVPFYGGGIAQNLGTSQCPMLAFFGGHDEWIPRDQVAQVEAHHAGDVVVYEDAEHGFMRDGSPNFHADASADAWTRLLAFFDQHLREH
jgi:carboxymethylenebutenolidase